jgi:hypothetical protein
VGAIAIQVIGRWSFAVFLGRGFLGVVMNLIDPNCTPNVVNLGQVLLESVL